MKVVWGISGLGVLLLATIAACTAETSDVLENEGAGAAGSAGSGGASSSSSGFDPGDGGGEPVGDGCDAVDMLFVIDNSPSMSPYQEALANAFPGFVDAMYAQLPDGTDLHVGVTTTSFFTGSCSESTVNCESAHSPSEIAAHYIPPTEGDTGTNGEQGRLFVHQGKPYYATNTGAGDIAGLKDWFTGAAVAAGETGCSFEMASAGAAYVAHPANAAHNGGFIRDEGAVLFVFVLSDEPDKSVEDVSAYVDMLTSAKSGCGGTDCILTAGIINPCVEQVDNKVWQFLNAFGEPPIVGDIDATGSYTDVVGDTLAATLEETCAQIEPPK